MNGTGSTHRICARELNVALHKPQNYTYECSTKTKSQSPCIQIPGWMLKIYFKAWNKHHGAVSPNFDFHFNVIIQKIWKDEMINENNIYCVCLSKQRLVWISINKWYKYVVKSNLHFSKHSVQKKFPHHQTDLWLCLHHQYEKDSTLCPAILYDAPSKQLVFLKTGHPRRGKQHTPYN